MYNKLFTKILDSSIWLESDAVRLVWITFLACMDQDGFVALSSVGNVARRAIVSPESAEEAIKVLESPDNKNPDQDHEGRRIERIPGSGWQVLNAAKYRDIIKAETARAQNRERVRRYRDKGNGAVMPSNESVTQSDAVAEAVSTTTTTTTAAKPKISDSEWLESLKTKKVYQKIDIDGEYEKAQTWADANGRQCTRRFFVGWLNRAKPMEVKNNGTTRQNNTASRSTTADRLRDTAESIAAKYPAEAELREDGSNAHGSQ